MPPQLNKSKNQALLDSSKYEQIVTHLERVRELNSLGAPDDFQTNTVTQKLQVEANKGKTGKTNSDANNSNPNKSKNETVYPVERPETQTIPQKIVTMEPVRQTGHFPGGTNRQ